MARLMVFSGHVIKVTESEQRCHVIASIDQSYSGFSLYDGTASITRLKKNIPHIQLEIFTARHPGGRDPT